MEKRPILISITAAILTLFTSEAIFKLHKAAKDLLYSDNGNFIYPLFSSLSGPIIASSWFIPGAIAGYICNKNPIKHGAVSGALFGLALGFISIAMSNPQTHALSMKLAHLSYAIVTVIENAVLFSISAAFGYQISKR